MGRSLRPAAARAASAFALLVLVAAAAPAQISPGPLSWAHARLEGAARCLDCHQSGQGVAPARCLACHTALRQRIAAGKGLHARADHQRCETCHIEHHGRDFDLVFWGERGRAAFDHRKTGFALQGAHARAPCQSCHRPERIRDPAALRAGGANPQRTFLGLSTACSSCHRDEHRGQLANQGCVTCHDQTTWRPASGFDHARTAFPLTGAHREVACASCHPRKTAAQPGDPDGAFLQLRGIRHESCGSCHRDPHAGRFGAQCQQCHTTAGWREGARASFDHDRTGFPLTGAHRQVACASCHRTRGPTGEAVFGRMAHARCSDCHRDPHEGRMGPQCASCPTTASWRGGPARAGLDHDRTRFPLRGAHREVPCQSCHPPVRPLRRGGFERCASCHRDPHLGQLDRTAAGPATCESCHTVEGFSPSTFTVAAHERAWPLRGGHLAVACIACHRSVPFAELPAAVRERAPPGGRPDHVRLFRFGTAGCPTCHGDPHRGDVARFVSAGGCPTCHRPEGWREVAFDHDRTGFALAGAHAAVPCRSCHLARGDGPAIGRLRFRGVSADCASCHRDPHPVRTVAGTARGLPACAECHVPVEWTRVRFDRDRHPRFPLQGAHREVACGACHRPTMAGGRRSVAFSPLPTTCEGCHAEPRRGG